jgi:hypothetical protein
VLRRRGCRGDLAAAALILVVLGLCPSAAAQSGGVPDPHVAQPERPTVGTHASTVSPGWLEIEAGFERQPAGRLSSSLAVPLVAKIGLGTRVQLNVAPAWQRDADDSRIESGITDLLLAMKWRLADDVPMLGDFAVQTAVSLPTGSAEAGRGTGSAGLSLLAISSHQLGSVTLDVNAGYTLQGGDGTIVPRHSTLWSVSSGFPIAGRLGWTAELFGLPGTSGPAGTRPVVAFLTGPTLAARGSLVLDAGATFDLIGFGRTAVYGGVTWNVGRLWRP